MDAVTIYAGIFGGLVFLVGLPLGYWIIRWRRAVAIAQEIVNAQDSRPYVMLAAWSRSAVRVADDLINFWEANPKTAELTPGDIRNPVYELHEEYAPVDKATRKGIWK